jgi:hypothetical protein
MEFRSKLQATLSDFCTAKDYEFKPVGGYRSNTFDKIVVEMWESSFDFVQMGLKGVMNSTRAAASVKIIETIPVAILIPKDDNSWASIVANTSDKWLDLLQQILSTGNAQIENARAGYINLDGVDYFVIETSVKGKF